MKKALLSLIAVAFLMASCGKSIDDIKPGMTEQEVEQALGKPNSTASSSNSSEVNGETVTENSFAEWKYHGGGTINFENGKVVKVTKE